MRGIKMYLSKFGTFCVTSMVVLLTWSNPVLAMPKGAVAVTGFEVERYMGTWYEIARLDHRFERGMSQVTATYSPREDGGVRVLNRGYKDKKQAWSEAEGRAKFVETADIGRLKVTFFWPFYGAYNIIALDKDNYSYAMVIGNNTKYLWILAREPVLEETILQDLLGQARQLGFDVEALIYPQKTSGGAD